MGSFNDCHTVCYAEAAARTPEGEWLAATPK